MQKITPHLWFDDNAQDAVKFYTKTFKNSRVTDKVVYKNSGPNDDMDVPVYTFTIEGFEFMAINAGPVFKFTPAISFFVTTKTQAEAKSIWKKLSAGGKTLMPLQKYPFSELYGWCNDKFGVSWQIMACGKKEIYPSLMFTQKNAGRLDDALKFYTKVFGKSKVEGVTRYGNEMPTEKGNIAYARFKLEGQAFSAMESAGPHKFTFNEAVSLFLKCKTQKEADTYYNKLVKGGEVQPCGWIKDKYGVSWQIVPMEMEMYLRGKDKAGAKRALHAMMRMKRLNVAQIKKAYEGR